jgi:hypothetical protein
MLFWGTANPTGEPSNYDGLHLRRDEIAQLVLDRALIGLPVKVEHKGDAVGHVQSAWQYGGRLDMLVKLDDQDAQGHIARHFVRNNVCGEMSLGYTVQMEQTAENGIRAGKKTITEVSIVKAGARDKCLIYGFLNAGEHRGK